MLKRLDERLLDEKLAALERARAWSPRVISKLEALLRQEDDFALFKVNPLKFGADKGVPEAESIDLFLHAAHLGLFSLNWQLVCPSCGDMVKSFANLGGLHSRLYCSMCRIDTLARLDDYIEVTFTVSPLVRAIAPHDPGSLSVEDYHFRYRFSDGARLPGGPKFSEALRGMVQHLSYLEAGEKKSVSVKASPGIFLGHDIMREKGFLFTVAGAPHAGTKSLSYDAAGPFVPEEGELTPGDYLLEFDNSGGTRGALMLASLPEEAGHNAILVFDPFLSGKRLLSTQTFRDLFRSETVGGSEGIAVMDLTLLFTDLKGSTALYDRIGDLKAFSLVQQHFERLGRAVRGNSGAIVKTIGDAVMASFLNPLDAVNAALVMLREIDKFNAEQGAREIILKIGVHKGASIAVNLNEHLDYFGQTVNIAARVQGLAEADQVCVTEEVYSYPGVAELFKGSAAAEEARLKGVEREILVRRLAFRPALTSPSG